MEGIIAFNTDQLAAPEAGADLFANRAAAAELQSQAAEVSIIIQAFNRLEKTRRCVESVLKYTQGVDYALILVDNGSTDGTLEYFKSVPYGKKQIIHITKNVGTAYPAAALRLTDMGKFICLVNNDLIVTAHWLENLLTCIRSDPKIGMVNPVSNHVSNLQNVNLPYESYAEMQQKAAGFNHSDPRKWADRLRLITLGTLYRKEALLAAGWPLFDAGFFHDFADDDITFRIRRMGYRTVLAGDTWICHDHDAQGGEGKNSAEFQRSLEIGRENFKKKYFGVDAWSDVINTYAPYLPHFPAAKAAGSARILGVDVRCGTPLLDIKNWLRTFSVFDTELSAFTQDPKYWPDLKTICGGPVVCDREEYLCDAFPVEYFDYVIADRPLNCCHEPQKILNDLFARCKSGGIVVCKLKNAFSFQEYAHLLGQQDVYNREFSYNIPAEAVIAALKNLGTIRAALMIPFNLDEDTQQTIGSLIPAELPEQERAALRDRMLCAEYLFVVEKQ